MKDAMFQEIQVDQTIAFIRNERSTPTKLLIGTVKSISEKSIIAETEDGTQYRVMFSTSPYKDNTRLIKAVVLGRRPKRDGEILDRSGYPIYEGDHIMYMEDVYAGASEMLLPGIVTQIDKNSVKIHPDDENKSDTKRSFERIVVVNTLKILKN